jgi:hypothetical protein
MLYRIPPRAFSVMSPKSKNALLLDSAVCVRCHLWCVSCSSRRRLASRSSDLLQNILNMRSHPFFTLVILFFDRVFGAGSGIDSLEPFSWTWTIAEAASDVVSSSITSDTPFITCVFLLSTCSGAGLRRRGVSGRLGSWICLKKLSA